MIDISKRLSRNFTLKELLQSDAAEVDEALKREQRAVPADVLANLTYMAETLLQPIRDGLGVPIRVKSGYRCARLNHAHGGSRRSQHLVGEAADLVLSPTFLEDETTADVRRAIESKVTELVGRPIRRDVDPNFYLFAYICLNLEDLDVDQVVHEYGDDFGRPAWVHVAASKRLDKRQVFFMGSYTQRRYMALGVEDALAKGCEPDRGVLGRLIGG